MAHGAVDADVALMGPSFGDNDFGYLDVCGYSDCALIVAAGRSNILHVYRRSRPQSVFSGNFWSCGELHLRLVKTVRVTGFLLGSLQAVPGELHLRPVKTVGVTGFLLGSSQVALGNAAALSPPSVEPDSFLCEVV